MLSIGSIEDPPGVNLNSTDAFSFRINVLNPSAISSIADHAMLQVKDISINIPKSSLHRPVQSSDKLDTGIWCRALTTLSLSIFFLSHLCVVIFFVFSIYLSVCLSVCLFLSLFLCDSFLCQSHFDYFSLSLLCLWLSPSFFCLVSACRLSI